jgi:hypothetical protein
MDDDSEQVDTCVVRIVRKHGRWFINGFQEYLEKVDGENVELLDITEAEF